MLLHVHSSNLQATYSELLKKIQTVKEDLSKSLPNTSEHKAFEVELVQLNTMLEQLQEVQLYSVLGIVKSEYQQF